MKEYLKKNRGMALVLLLCLLFTGCAAPEEKEQEPKDRTISELSIPGLLEHCVDETGEHCYYTVTGESTIYKCTMDGTPVVQFAITADEGEPDIQSYISMDTPERVNLSGLCIYGDTLYCFRPSKGTLLAVDVNTGENRVLTTMEVYSVYKMAAGASSVLVMNFGMAGKALTVYHTDTGVTEQVPVKQPLMFAHAGEDTYWINTTGEDGTYGFQKYQADTGAVSEFYESNFTYELTEMAYDKASGLLYGRMYSLQYLCFKPEEAEQVSRFTAQAVYQSPACFQTAGGRLFIQDVESGKVYHFDPAAYVTWNEPLKGYVTSEFSVTEWAGYNIDLEVVSWDELALKVLAEDRDYDFVIMTTDMAEATSLRDAMAYLPIPEKEIEGYWAECWPCVKQGASYNGDIWMLPLEVCARGLAYSEQNLAEYGLSIENIKTMPQLCEAAKVLHENGESGWYTLQPMQDNLLQEYLWKYRNGETINFDTPEFRAIMEFIREEYKKNDYSDNYYRSSMINLSTAGMDYDENSGLSKAEQIEQEQRRLAARVYLEETGTYSTFNLEKYIGAEGMRVRPVPGMSGTEETVQISGTFLVLNPNSRNQEELMEFVSAMAETYIASPATYLSSNAERYVKDVVMQDICELYRSGEMVFGMPDDLFTSYYKYVMGQDLDPDEVVKELNRVVNMYYGE